jgi:hypothetical protein
VSNDLTNLNVKVEPAVVATAKEAAEKAGMMLRKWVARAIMHQAALEARIQTQPTEPAPPAEPTKELVYEPVDQ